MNVKVSLDNGAFLPEKAHAEDAGYDLRTIKGAVVPKRGSAIFDTGVHIQIPYGYEAEVRSRSGLYFKHGIFTVGTVDCGYTGAVRVKLTNASDEDYEVMDGERIAQLVIERVSSPDLILVEHLESTERGGDGFGSTGRQ